MAAVLDHHDQSPATDPPARSPDQACPAHSVITTLATTATTWSSPPPAFPVTPHDVADLERPLEKTIEPFQSEVSPTSALSVGSPEYQPDPSRANEPPHPQQATDPTPPVDQSQPPTAPSLLSAVPAPSLAPSPSPPPPIEHSTSLETPAESTLPEPVHLSPCPPAAATPPSPELVDTPAPGGRADSLQELTELVLATADPPEHSESLQLAPSPPDGVNTPLPASTEKDFPTQPASASPSPADLHIIHPTPNSSFPEPADNPNPISTDPIVTAEQTASSAAAAELPSPAPLQPSTPPPLSTADRAPHHDHPAACSPHPYDTAASLNSLSPLSEVPSATSPPHAVGSPTTESSQPHPLPRTSPASFKRQPSPSMYENVTGLNGAEDSSPCPNGQRPELDGQSAPKRPRLANDYPSNPQTTSLPLSNSLSTQTPTNAHLPAPLDPIPSTHPPQSTSEVTGFIPGTIGTRLTKDQHRFAVSVTKQLKKHRSALPFVFPVDPVELNIPDYPNVIKEPMDLTTIETRLGKAGKPCHYRSVEEFVADIQLVFTNCYKYNGPPAVSTYSRMALDLSIQFETQMKKMPPDERLSHASTSRSPSLAKPVSKPKQPTERTLPPTLKRKNGSPAATAPFQAGHQNGKRRSVSPQPPRKKSTKATSFSASVPSGADSMSPHTVRRTSVNDPSSSQRPRPGTWDPSPQIPTDCGTDPYSREQATISNAKAELKFCKDLLREVNKKSHSKFVWPFYEPVDIVKLGIPDYPKFVKKPMDLETMKQKLNNNEYPDGAAFAADFRLMLNNCFTFNPPGTAYHECGKQLESLFESKWTERPPEEIPAPAPPSMPAVSNVTSHLDPIQEMQMQITMLQHRLETVVSNSSHGGAHPAAGTGPAKKNSVSRASAPSKSSPNLATSAPLVPPSTLSTASKSKAAGSAKPKQANGGARRKSAGSTLTAAAKRQDHQPLTAQLEQSELAHGSHQLLPPAAATLPPPPPSAGMTSFSGPDYFEVIDYEQKKDLANQIQNAVEPMQSDAINLIRNSRPDLVAADGEEIELDIDALDERTLYQLYQLVCAPVLPSAKPKRPKAVTTNGKSKGTRKAGSGATRKSMPTPLSSYALPASHASGGPPADLSSVSPYSSAQVTNGHENGTKPKVKKPRASVPGPPKRKGIDETQEAARIRGLEEKLNQFGGTSNSQPHPTNHSNGVSSANLALGPNPSAPPAGPVEYASSSSESESESDDDSD